MDTEITSLCYELLFIPKDNLVTGDIPDIVSRCTYFRSEADTGSITSAKAAPGMRGCGLRLCLFLST